MRIILSILFILSVAVTAFLLSLKQSKNIYAHLCNEVYRRMYYEDQKLRDWHVYCLDRSNLVQPWTSRERVVNDFKKLLGLLEVSHLDLIVPEESASMWYGENKDHGLITRYMNEKPFIFRTREGSSAAQAGLRFGDYLLKWNDKDFNSYDLSNEGFLKYERQEQAHEVKLKAQSYNSYQGYKINQLKTNSKTVNVIEVDHFSDPQHVQDLKRQLQKISTNELTILDLRDHAGGDFAVALDFINLFVCSKEDAGVLIKPRHPQNNSIEFNTSWKPQEQIENLQKHRELKLTTQNNPTCFKNLSAILVDDKTASTAEMVALVLQTKNKIPLIGQRTAGRLLVGISTPIPELGEGYELYVPEAEYQYKTLVEDDLPQKIEGQGLFVSQSAHYRAEDLKKGLDSFILIAVKAAESKKKSYP